MEKIIAVISTDRVSSNSKKAFELFENSNFGEKISDKIIYSPYEALFLMESNKIEIQNLKNKKISEDELIKILEKNNKKFRTNYEVFKDLRKKGNIVKTGLKFGAEFRVYKKGSKLGKDHATWILFPVKENDKLTWQNFSAKNRVAHSTNKNLLIAILDDENNISYYEINWLNLK